MYFISESLKVRKRIRIWGITTSWIGSMPPFASLDGSKLGHLDRCVDILDNAPQNIQERDPNKESQKPTDWSHDWTEIVDEQLLMHFHFLGGELKCQNWHILRMFDRGSGYFVRCGFGHVSVFSVSLELTALRKLHWYGAKLVKLHSSKLYL